MAITQADVLNMHAFVPNPTMSSPYPVGIWKAARTIVTDASGGVVRWTVGPPSLTSSYKYLWNLEEYSWITSVVSAIDYGLYTEVYTGEVVSRAGGTEVLRFATLRYLANGGGGRVGLLGATVLKDHNMQFIHQPGGGNLNQYIMEIQNPNNQVYTFTMWGYFWNSEARRLASGPRRP